MRTRCGSETRKAMAMGMSVGVGVGVVEGSAEGRRERDQIGQGEEGRSS